MNTPKTIWLATAAGTAAVLLATYIFTFQVLHREILVLKQLLEGTEKATPALGTTTPITNPTGAALTVDCPRFEGGSVRGNEECWVTNKNGEGYGVAYVRGVWSPYSTESPIELAISDTESSLMTCGALTIQSGNESLIATLTTLVRDGNALNRLTPEGALVLTINTEDLAPHELARLESGAPTGLMVLYDVPKGVGATPCSSSVRVLGVVD